MSVECIGIAAAPGLALGRVAIWRPAAPSATAPPKVAPTDAGPGGAAAALDRFRAAATRVAADLAALQDDLVARAGAEAAEILSAQALMAQDPELEGAVWERLQRGEALVSAIDEAGEAIAAVLEGLEDPYLRQRAADIRDVTGRIAALAAGRRDRLSVPYDQTVVIAPEIPPSVIASIDGARVIAIVTAGGGATSHAALLAKGLGIPAVMGCADIIAQVQEGDLVAVDGTAGSILVRPNPAQERAFKLRVAEMARLTSQQQGLRDLPAVTADGRRVMLSANVSSARETRAALAFGAEGVGLFRSEFLFLGRSDLPDEVEQFTEYRAAAEAMAPAPVVIRTLDIGGDKPLSALPLPAEENPFLGWRGIRLWLNREDLAIPQIRAILRACSYGEVHILLPMVSSVSEVVQARDLIEQVRSTLGDAAGPHRLGVMVEVPAAALIADDLAAEVDFFSIGTNDLTQYTLAVDRGNPSVAPLYDPLHPAVLKLIRMTVEAAGRRGIPVALCGDAAADARVIPALVALGINELSMPAGLIPAVKHQVRGL